MSEQYYRCRGCRGFYETTRAACKWCGGTTVFTDRAGRPRVFAGRATARAVQIAEYEQLPPEARADCFRPPPEQPGIRCQCQHCGPNGPVFEAIEMRWLAGRKLWACPSTRCGGVGFGFDIHPVAESWRCVACGWWYAPKGSGAADRCPRCGCTEGSGAIDGKGEACTDDAEAGWFEDDACCSGCGGVGACGDDCKCDDDEEFDEEEPEEFPGQAEFLADAFAGQDFGPPEPPPWAGEGPGWGEGPADGDGPEPNDDDLPF